MRLATFFLLGILTCVGAVSAPLSVASLRCEYLNDPLGIDVPTPRLSWVLASEARGARQSAWQVLVASTPELLAMDKGDLWDSGKVTTDHSNQVPYDGETLHTGQRCHWKVRTWNRADEVSPWSAPAFWSMGLLNESDWKGEWIGMNAGAQAPTLQADALQYANWIWYPGDEPVVSPPPGERYFRARFEVPDLAAVEAVKAWFTADNRAELFINGEAAASIETYNEVRAVDLTGLVRAGENVVAIAARNNGAVDNPAGLLAAFEVRFTGGTTLTKGSDASWRSSAQAEEGWKSSSFDDSVWKAAHVLGPLGCEPWPGVGFSDKRKLAARMLRKDFEVDARPIRATAYISGLGLFALHINGQRIGDEVLAPGLTEYNKRAFYRSFDVTAQLQDGANAVGVILGNGRYFAPRGLVPTRTTTYGLPSLRFQLELNYADGRVEHIVSDKTWKVTDQGPVLANNEYDGEQYDARREMPGWSAPGFDASAWASVDRMDARGGVLSAQMAEPIRVTGRVSPKTISQPKPGMYIFDMGQNMVGWCRLKVEGPAGSAVKLRFAETLKDDGTLYLANIRGAEVTDVYTLKGTGVETWAPEFTYHGFRYVEMTGYPGEPSLDSLEGELVNDDMASSGTFTCSNPLLNQIYKNIEWGVRGNYRSVPTDCPQRDERQGWLGDRSAECTGESYLFDVAAFYAKWATDIEDAQRDDGSVSDVCPSYWPMYNDNVTWPSTLLMAPHMLLTQYGDTRSIEEHYDGMQRWIAHMEQYIQDGLMPKDNYGDWCVPPEEEHLIHSNDESRKTSGEVLGTTYFIYDLKLMAKYATMLGKPEDAERYVAQAQAMSDAFNKKYWNADTGYYANGSQTAQVLPLYFGIAPAEAEGPAFDYLVKKIMVEGKGHIGTGLVGGQWLMRTLSDRGRADVAYTMATQTDYPSWGYMIGQGATTIWELWNGNTADPAMNSHNHVMLVGDLCIWFHEYLAGIRPDPEAPGFKHILMKPHVVGDLTHVSATHRSLYGEIRSAWKVTDGALVWEVTVPPNTTATVSVPVKYGGVVREGNVPAESAEGVKLLAAEGGYSRCEVVAGTYRFSTAW